MLTTRASGKAMAEVELTAEAATRSPPISSVSRSSGTGLPSMRTSDSPVTVALLSRFLRLNRTPSSTFSRLPRVYICFRMRPGIFIASPRLGFERAEVYRGGGGSSNRPVTLPEPAGTEDQGTHPRFPATKGVPHAQEADVADRRPGAGRRCRRLGSPGGG